MYPTLSFPILNTFLNLTFDFSFSAGFLLLALELSIALYYCCCLHCSFLLSSGNFFFVLDPLGQPAASPETQNFLDFCFHVALCLMLHGFPNVLIHFQALIAYIPKIHKSVSPAKVSPINLCCMLAGYLH